MRPLPPLNALRAFEAAARLGSYSRAAEELGVTHGAISRHIQSLQAFLGAELFRPAGRNRVPTERAAAYLAEVSAALDRLAGATERMREPSAAPSVAMTRERRRRPPIARLGSSAHEIV